MTFTQISFLVHGQVQGEFTNEVYIRIFANSSIGVSFRYAQLSHT